MKIKYNLEDYKNGVRKFIEDTKNWSYTDNCKFYVASGNVMDVWEESCDNANNGLDVSWAFQKENISDLEIVEQFYKKIIEILNCDIDNDVDYINYIELEYKQ